MVDDTLAVVLRYWQRRTGAATRWEPLHHKGTVLLVSMESGAAFVLKCLKEAASAEQVDSERRVLTHLQAAGVPVAVPLLTDDGRAFVEHQGRLYTLAPALLNEDHNSYDTPRTYRNLGAAIGRLHKALATYPYEIQSWHMKLPQRTSTAAARINARLGEPEVSTLNEALDGLWGGISAVLTGLPEQYIHGDCHGGNVVVNGETVMGFIDLDHLPLGPRVYDIGYFLADMAKNRAPNPAAAGLWLATFNQVVAGYHEENDLSAREREAIWYVMLVTQLLFTEYFLEHQNERLVRFNLDAFYWILRHRKEITRRILEA